MKRSFGIICMLFGVLMLFGAIALHLKNTEEDKQAQESAEHYLPKLMQMIDENIAKESALPPTQTDQTPESDSSENTQTETQEPIENMQTQLPLDPDYYSTEMTVELIDGYGFVGYLTFPSLGLQLPVMSESDDTRLKLSPCRFSGSTRTDDLVLGGHNYSQHFGQISGMKTGDQVYFTDMDGKLWHYELITMEILEPNDVDELTKGEYPLTLFTCTYGGGSRIILRFDLIDE